MWVNDGMSAIEACCVGEVVTPTSISALSEDQPQVDTPKLPTDDDSDDMSTGVVVVIVVAVVLVVLIAVGFVVKQGELPANQTWPFQTEAKLMETLLGQLLP